MSASQQLTVAPISPDTFKAAFRHHPGGVSVITARGPEGPVAMTATSVTSVSAEPALLVFSVSDLSSAAPVLRTAESVVVHLLDVDGLELARLAATHGADRFADTSSWASLPTGEPVFHRTRWLRAVVIQRVPAGTATLLIAEAVESNVTATDAATPAPADGLAYLNRVWHRLGVASRIDDPAI